MKHYKGKQAYPVEAVFVNGKWISNDEYRKSNIKKKGNIFSSLIRDAIFYLVYCTVIDAVYRDR